ncbi:MAG: MFS transporter, partial [Pirellulaceae bacterium]
SENEPDETPDPLQSDSLQKRNFLAISAYQVMLRIGWIFKTESIIVPAALDSLGASGFVRGFLPMFGRFGQSVPPLLIWPLLISARRQRNWLAVTTLLMGLLFWALSALWHFGWHERGDWIPQAIFLVLYGLFFMTVGVNQLTLSSLIGKLIRVHTRGRLMLVANTLGAACSVTAAWFLLQRWLGQGEANFAAIFGMSGSCFLISAVLTYLLREPVNRRARKHERFHLQDVLADVVRTFREDANFRLLAVISGLCGMSMTLLPHYQTLARERLDLGFSDLLPWVIAQNIGVALFSIPAGAVADRLGNRVVLRVILLLLTLAPIAALFFSTQPAVGKTGFMGVFFLLGLTPVTMRILSNYTLEFTTVEHQPRYLAAQKLSMAAPVIFTSTILGLTLDFLGFELVFCLVIACLALAWYLTFRVHEPREIQQ